MSAIIDRNDWLEARRQGIGGSDAAAILGLSPWSSPLDIYLDKIGQNPPKEETDAMRFGTLLEEVVASEFSLRSGLKVRRKRATLHHPEHDWMIAHVDRMIVGGGLLECKTCNAFKAGDWDYGNVPEHYQVQVQHYLAVTGEPFAYIAVLIGGQRFESVRIDRDEVMIQVIIDWEQRFWFEHVLKRIPPEPTGMDSETLGKMFPESNGLKVDLPSNAEGLLRAYEQAKGEEAEAKARKEEAANRLKSLLGENEIGTLGDWRVSWKPVVSQRFDTKRFQTEQGDLYQQYLTPSASRRFDVKGAGK